jgi:hypothetical protein
MACFLAPATAALITTSIRKKVPKKYHLEWLSAMLWGGVVMLAVEHIAHGEVTLFPPFLTAMQNPDDIPMMLKEIATVGTAMTVATTVAWGVIVLIANKVSKMREGKLQVTRT